MMQKQSFRALLILTCFATNLSFAGEIKREPIGSDQIRPVSSVALFQGLSTLTDSAQASPARLLGKDSLTPNQGFNDLFVSTKSSTTSKSNARLTTVRLNPKAISFVEDYMDKQSTHLIKLKEWGRPYFNMMDGILIKHGLPKELKYLAVIESKLRASAVSWAGAVGPWQFMPATAKNYGLKVSRSYDERTDFVKSTHAAAKYLKYLYSEFGDWLLVIAAYNGGPGVVYNAMKRSGSSNFWDLQYYLPAESRTHVKKFIGTHYIFEGEGGITTLTRKETSEQVGIGKNQLILRNLTTKEEDEVRKVKIAGKYHSEIIAKHVLMDMTEFNRYNPNFDRVIAAAENRYELHLPPAKMELFIAHKYQILEESINVLLNGAQAANKF